MIAFQKLKTKRLMVGGLILVLLVMGVASFMRYSKVGTAHAQATPTIKSAEVTIGDLTTEISGTGSIVALNPVDLSFSTTGKVAELYVNPGKSVEEGDVLAKLDRISTLQMNVENAKLNLAQAQKALDDLETNKEITLANALTAQSEAAAALETAKNGQVNKYSGRCEKNVTESYYIEYMFNRSNYLFWYNALIKQNTGYGDMYIQQNMAPWKKAMNQNYSNWKYCEGYSELEINQSNAAVEKAQAEYEIAKEHYETIKNNNGIDPDEFALAEITKKNAELQLEEAQRILDGATLTSPIDGTVISVAAPVGEILDKDSYQSPYIEIADLTKPVVKANFDETDLAGINSTCAVKATFTAIPNKTFSGTITRIDPSLTTTNNVSSVSVYINIETDSASELTTLPVGMNSTIDLTCTTAHNALLVPIQALKDEQSGKAIVYVLNSDGTYTEHSVEVGEKTLSMAEIKGDIKAGDRVVTSTIK